MEKNVKPKKKIGQHFLSDDNIAKKIIDLVNFKNHRHIVEVGPGMGALTDHLVDSAKNLTLIEIDNECIEYLEKKYLNKNNSSTFNILLLLNIIHVLVLGEHTLIFFLNQMLF